MSDVLPVRWSNLKHILRSPAHYKYYLEHPLAVTSAMRFGSLVGSIVLGATHKFVVWDGGDRRGNAWKEFEAAHSGVEIVKRSEYDEAFEVARAVIKNKDARDLLNGVKEQTLNWKIGDRDCRGTPDLRGSDGIVTDLKVTADARPDKFIWHALRMGWLAQLSWYGNAVECLGQKFRGAALIAVEPKPPYPVVVYSLCKSALLAGTKQWRSAWEQLLVCEDIDNWPSYSDCIVPLEAPEDLALIIDGEEVPA